MYQLSPDFPFQSMLALAPIQVVSMRDFYDASSLLPHRHEFYMLQWTLEGEGTHKIDFREYEMTAGRLFFLHQNQIHQVQHYPKDGWMVLFNLMFFREFLRMNPDQEQKGLFDYFNRHPYVDMDERLLAKLDAVVRLMGKELAQDPNLTIVQSYLSILLLHAAEVHSNSSGLVSNQPEAEVMRKLKVAMEANFRSSRETSYYATALGYTPRRLNELSTRTVGLNIQELINQRLLAEIEGLLAGTDTPIKEIAYSLGFIDQSHLATFFRKHKGERPSDFRQKFRPRP